MGYSRHGSRSVFGENKNGRIFHDIMLRRRATRVFASPTEAILFRVGRVARVRGATTHAIPMAKSLKQARFTAEKSDEIYGP